jgi:hypothetical protein
MQAPSRCLLLVLITAALVLTGRPGRADQLAYDGFRLSFPVYASGGTGFTGPWAQGGFNAFASGYGLEEASLCYPKLQRSGGSVSGDAFSAINGVLRSLRQPLGSDNTTAYISFLVRPEGALNAGIFNGFLGLTLNGTLGSDLFIGKPGGGAENRYVLENRGGFGQVSSNTEAVVGRTALLVVKAQFRTGADVFTLYTNPAPGSPEPATGVVKSDLDLGMVPAIGIYSSGAFTLDEIRIGTTYADVVPAVDHTAREFFESCEEDDDGHDHR